MSDLLITTGSLLLLPGGDTLKISGDVVALGAAAGVATVDGVGYLPPGRSYAAAPGVATVDGVGRSIARAIGVADGMSLALGVGRSQAHSVGAAEGSSSVLGYPTRLYGSRPLAQAFADEKDLLWARPFLSAVFHIGGVVGDVYVADRDIAIGAHVHRGAVATWGEWRTLVEPRDGAFQVSAMTVEIINQPIDWNGATRRFSDLWAGAGIEGVEVDVYQNFVELGTDTILQEEFFTGVVRVRQYRPARCALELVSVAEKYLDKNEVSFVIDSADYPSADLDDVGQRANQIYGAVKKIKCHAIVAGPASVLHSDMILSDYYVRIYDDFHDVLPAAGIVQIGNEQIQYTGKAGDSLSKSLFPITRGYAGTPVETHFANDTILQVLTSYVYQAAGHPMKSVDRVYIQRGDKIITVAPSDYTLSLADTALVAGRALTTIAFSSPPTLVERPLVDVALIDTIAVADTIGVADSIGVAQPNTEMKWSESGGDHQLTFTRVVSALNHWVAGQVGATALVTLPALTKAITSGNYHITFGLSYWSGGASGLNLYCNGVKVLHGQLNFDTGPRPVTISSPTYSVLLEWKNDNASTLTAPQTYTLTMSVGAPRVEYNVTNAVSKTGSAVKTGAAVKTGTVSLSSTSSAETVIGDAVLVDGQGYADDGAGTYTGAPGALIQKPADVIHHLARALGNIPVARIDVAALQRARNDAPAFYRIAAAISERTNVKELLLALGMQSRLAVDFPAGQLTARFLKTLYPAPLRVLTRDQIMADPSPGQAGASTLALERAPIDDLQNVVNLYYGRYWAWSRGRNAFNKVIKTSDAASIARYGRREQIDRFLFDFVAEDNAAMAADAAAFWLARLKEPARLVSLDAKLDQFDLLPGDVIGIDYEMPGHDFIGPGPTTAGLLLVAPGNYLVTSGGDRIRFATSPYRIFIPGDKFDGLNGAQKFLIQAIGHRPGSARDRRATRMNLQLREVS